jgi:hypothetical protein
MQLTKFQTLPNKSLFRDDFHTLWQKDNKEAICKSDSDPYYAPGARVAFAPIEEVTPCL